MCAYFLSADHLIPVDTHAYVLRARAPRVDPCHLCLI
jgi:hypothetical protein